MCFSSTISHMGRVSDKFSEGPTVYMKPAKAFSAQEIIGDFMVARGG